MLTRGPMALAMDDMTTWRPGMCCQPTERPSIVLWRGYGGVTGAALTWHPRHQLERAEHPEGAEHGQVRARSLTILRLGHQQGKEPGERHVTRRSPTGLAMNF